MKYTLLPFVMVLLLATNAYSEDTFIGHVYPFSCPYYGCDTVESYARPLFKKTANGWQAFPNDQEIGNNPDALRRAYKLFPEKIKWYIFNHDQSLIGEETVENNKPVAWWFNAGASKMRFDPAKIKPNSAEKDDYDASNDLILSTNKNIVFSKFKSRMADINSFESSVQNIKAIENQISYIKNAKKEVTIYSFNSVDVIAILNYIEVDDGCDWCDHQGFVLVKRGKTWQLAFDHRRNIDQSYTGPYAAFSLKAVADFDNSGKDEYIFTFSIGEAGYGYILWQDGMTKPLVYIFHSH